MGQGDRVCAARVIECYGGDHTAQGTVLLAVVADGFAWVAGKERLHENGCGMHARRHLPRSIATWLVLVLGNTHTDRATIEDSVVQLLGGFEDQK